MTSIFVFICIIFLGLFFVGIAFFRTFAADSDSPKGWRVGNLLKKGRLRTLSSAAESRKFMTRRNATVTSTLGVLYHAHFLLWVSSICLGVGYRVAYPGQGNARAQQRDRRNRAPTSFHLITLTAESGVL